MESQNNPVPAPPVKVKQDKKAFIIAIIIVLVFLGVCGLMKYACSNMPTLKNVSEKTTTKKEKQPDVTVYAHQLYSDYHKNEVAADQKYKNKILSVTGGIKEIRKDFLDNVVIDLTTDNEFMSINCTVKKKYEGDAALLSKGGTITLVGKCKGMILGSPQIDDCEIK